MSSLKFGFKYALFNGGSIVTLTLLAALMYGDHFCHFDNKNDHDDTTGSNL